jgi:hypothetical protein
VLFVVGDNSFQNFFMFGSSVAEFTKKFCIYNINAPGQEVDANRLSDKYGLIADLKLD